MSMAVLFWITLGMLAAAIAKLVAWENASWSLVLPLGSLGAIAGGVVAGLLSPNSDTPGFDTASIFLALLGAVVLLWPYKLVLARRRAETTEDLPRSRRAA